MMSLETIRQLSEEAAERAIRRREEPAEFAPAELERAIGGDLSGIRIPNLGTHCPEGWARVNVEEMDSNPRGVNGGDNDGFGAYFVDSSGFGQRGEPALTLGEFIRRIRPGYGYAVVEAGQFQVKVGVFIRR